MFTIYYVWSIAVHVRWLFSCIAHLCVFPVCSQFDYMDNMCWIKWLDAKDAQIQSNEYNFECILVC